MLHNPYSNHYHQIHNPPTPFGSDIPNGLVPGKQIFVSGTFNPNASRIRVDLVTRNGSIALHINPRFDQNALVRNSQLGGAWGAEERSGGFTLQRGQAFEFVILVENDQYKVAINGQHAFDYRHRCPYQEVSRLNVDGDCRVNRIVYSHGANGSPSELKNPPIPISIPVNNGLAYGRMIQIHGQVRPSPQKFSINLQNGPGNHYPNDIALHFNPRYYDGSFVVKNNRVGGGWQSEEREQNNPFHPGAPFEVLILVDPAEFKIAVNGQHFTSFRHRNGLQDGNYLSIDGDVTIQSIRQF